MPMWEILVPCQWNSGKPVRTRHHKEWDRKVRKLSGGLTILMPGKGQWINKEGELFEERVIPVRISCDKKTIERIMDITAEHYKQYAVLAWKVSEEVLLKDYEPK